MYACYINILFIGSNRNLATCDTLAYMSAYVALISHHVDLCCHYLTFTFRVAVDT